MTHDLDIPAFLRARNRPPECPQRRETVLRRMGAYTRAHRTSDAPSWFKGDRNQLPKTMDAASWELLRQQTERKRIATEERIDSLRSRQGKPKFYQQPEDGEDHEPPTA